MAPGLNRNFSAEGWHNIPKGLWDKAREEARDAARIDREAPHTGLRYR